jgi:hypothetical protein
MLPVATAVAGSLRPDPGPARAWLEDELRRPEYHRQSLAEQVLSWLSGLWRHLTDSALHASSLSTAAAVLVAVALLVLLVLVVARVRAEGRAPRPEGPVLGPVSRSADQHHAAAREALAAGRLDAAVVEAFRAAARRSVDRGLLDERPGLTAHEIAEAVWRVAPGQHERMLAAAEAFEAVFYGGRPATGAQAEMILRLDDTLRAAEPAPRPHDGSPGPMAVPR